MLRRAIPLRMSPKMPSEKATSISLPQLDGLRFVAFFLVLVHHWPARPYFSAGSFVGAVLSRASDFGWTGVDIFLTLSSFLIVTLLTLERAATGTISIKNFYVRRALRIWPLYYWFVLFGMVLLPLVLPPDEAQRHSVEQHLLPFLTFTGNFSSIYFSVLPLNTLHLWTISLEEQFYLFVPIIVLFAPRIGKPLWWWALGLLLLTALFRAYIQWNEVRYPTLWMLPVSRLDPFIVGAVCAWVFAARRHWLRPGAGWVLAVCGVAGFVFVAQFENIGTSSFHIVWQLTMVALSAGCLLLASISSSAIAAVLSWGSIGFLGKISFGLYVYHELAINLMPRFFPLGEPFGQTPLAWLVTLGIILSATVLVSACSYYGYERQFLRLKERFERIRSRPA